MSGLSLLKKEGIGWSQNVENKTVTGMRAASNTTSPTVTESSNGLLTVANLEIVKLFRRSEPILQRRREVQLRPAA
jgi:hypothetical protein